MFIEGALIAWLASRPVWNSAHPTAGVAAGGAAFYLYSVLYMIPYLNQALSVVVSIPWGYLAGYAVETWFDDGDRVDVWSARVVAFLVSAIAHWALTDSST